MIQLRRHNSRDYAALPDIDLTTAGHLAEDDHACLAEIGSCLIKDHANKRFGATLLHSHFPVRDGEVLVEEAHADQQLITLRPISGKRPSLVANSVCFDGAGGPLALVGLEFTSEETLAGIRPLGRQDRDVLTGLYEILQRHDKSGRFGLRLLHDPLGLGGRVLLETCEPANRVLTCRTTTEDDPNFAEAIPTLFQWEASLAHGDSTISQGCMQFCKSVRKCAVSRSGHQSSSSHDSSHARSAAQGRQEL
ncbi:hypothetical protein [Bradyrhizobium australafricanum]|uniref:hypothetical protein n=1 Tax=Bradyrhizobium australafricanum TaxID=2821406 RepID=UPI001CE2A80C|nr:hypothetical protein [Bradyrhizobium australafricanum]MCA6103653.1 hypothetical protein [Bradyrhizobium australafricanum]